MCGDPWPISVSNTNLTSGTKSSLLSPSDRDRQSMNWPGLWLCSVVRSVFVQPIANYPLLIAENSDKISEERSQLWNSDRFFANNNKLIGTLLTANFQGMEEKLSSSTGKQNISTSKLFSHHHHNILIPHSIPSVCYQLLVPDKYISVVSL